MLPCHDKQGRTGTKYQLQPNCTASTRTNAELLSFRVRPGATAASFRHPTKTQCSAAVVTRSQLITSGRTVLLRKRSPRRARRRALRVCRGLGQVCVHAAVTNEATCRRPG